MKHKKGDFFIQCSFVLIPVVTHGKTHTNTDPFLSYTITGQSTVLSLLKRVELLLTEGVPPVPSCLTSN